MLGLRRGAVQLASHDPRWIRYGSETAQRIAMHLGLPTVRVQHVGSTAVRSLRAKPILDIVVGIESASAVDDAVVRIAELGFVDHGTGPGSVGRFLVMEPYPGFRTIHLHIVRYESDDWRAYIDFRDALCADAELRARYVAVKHDLARRHRHDRRTYRDRKAEFVEAELKRLLR